MLLFSFLRKSTVKAIEEKERVSALLCFKRTCKTETNIKHKAKDHFQLDRSTRLAILIILSHNQSSRNTPSSAMSLAKALSLALV